MPEAGTETSIWQSEHAYGLGIAALVCGFPYVSKGEVEGLHQE
jgi:hypothetical protein